MAKKEKKQKPVLTPEELQAKRERKAEKAKIFGKTFVSVLAVLLSILLVYSMVYMAFGQGMTVVQKVTGSSSGSSSSGTSGGSSSSVTPSSGGSSSSATPSSGGSSTPATPSSGGSSSGSGNSTGAATDAASVASLINSATAAAVNAKAGYDWSRDCTVANIDVGGSTATGIINRLIGTISEGDDLNSVVGGFLGNGSKKQTVPKGMTLDTIDVPKDDGGTEKLYHGSSYTLKASNLQAGDIQNLQVNGDTYEFDLTDSQNPDRSGNTALSRFCNDIVVREEVESELKGYTDAVTVNSLDASYHNIHVKAVIKDGQLQDLTYTMKADATLGIKIGIAITGTGNLDATARYTNFVY